MRIATNTTYQNSIFSMQNTTASISEAMVKMSYGKAILKPSDDPIGSVRVMGLEQDNSAASQYIDNISNLSDYYSRAESALTGMTDSMLRITELVTAAGNGAATPENREAYASELRSLQDSLVDMANSKDANGAYLFAGNQTGTQPISQDAAGNYVYGGDSGTRQVPISDSAEMDANFSGDELFFNGGADIFNGLNDYIAVLEDPTLGPGDAAFDGAHDQMKQLLGDSRDDINAAVTTMGGNQNSLTMMESYHEDMVLYNTKVIGETEDLDYAAAMTDYSTNLTVLQATQQTYVKIANLSLFNEI
ncbi:flagellar hook-associated protein FlgL [uncultured Ferrimonas sp.]|uniref:flagellar hook-associated protein FlgL n=1 Tax=uncultured Ferrimonas sp. TaxID=432640 RepID=UPI00262D6038|nr:flagellar hook-associated protein FlgL [uncultured Ferrimonas sp.]